MVHSACQAAGMVRSLFRRCYNHRRGYEPIPRWEEEEEDEKAEITKPQDLRAEDGVKMTFSRKDEIREGESQEACGDRLLARFRSHPAGAGFTAYKDLHYAADFYLHAGSWRKAALAFGELAAYCLKTGRRSGAGSALLRSAKCYAEIEDKTLDQVVAMKLALDEALALFARMDQKWLAARTCSDLAEFHMEHNELHSALVFYQRVAKYLATFKDQGYDRFYVLRADHVRFLLDNQEALRAKGDLPLVDYKRKSTGYMKPTDPDWGQRLSELLSSSSLARRARVEEFLLPDEPYCDGV